jgi:hypothetical protein
LRSSASARLPGIVKLAMSMASVFWIHRITCTNQNMSAICTGGRSSTKWTAALLLRSYKHLKGLIFRALCCVPPSAMGCTWRMTGWAGQVRAI